MTTTTYSLDSLLSANKSSTRKDAKADSHERSFYHLAAALAHQNSDSLAGSQLLESDYQDCLLSFNARGKRLDIPKAKSVITALNKLLISRLDSSFNNLCVKTTSRSKLCGVLDQPEHAIDHEGLSFAPEEIAALIVWASASWQEFRNKENYVESKNAASFHHELTSMAQRPGQRPFWFCAQSENQLIDMLVLKVNLFSANRLSKKSWQIDNGATPGVRYYHAALYAEQGSTPLDVLYWLKFDDSHHIIAGEFIHQALPKGLLCPISDLCRWADSNLSQDAALIKEVILMYKLSLGH